MCFVTLLTAHPQIDFNAVGADTNLKAPAARMRYSRLKRNIEIKIGVNIRKGPAASIQGPAMNKIKSAVGSNKKRKASYESGDEGSDVAAVDEEVGNVLIQDEGPQELTFGPRTRGKKIDMTSAFDSDHSTGPEQRNGDKGSSSDYEMEDVSEDKEEFHVDEADEEEDYQPVPMRRKSSPSASKKTRTAKSAITSFKKSIKPVPRSVPDNYAKTNVASPKVPVPVTPERGISVTSETKGKSVTLPLTPQSIPSTLNKQKSVDSTLIKPEPGTGANQLSAAARSTKVRHATPQTSLFDRIEKARMQADRNLSSLADEANKTSRFPNYSAKTDGESILPSIERDDEQDEGTMLRARSRSSSMSADTASLSPLYYTSTFLDADDESVKLQANTLATQLVLRDTSRSTENPTTRQETKTPITQQEMNETGLLPHCLYSASCPSLLSQMPTQ